MKMVAFAVKDAKAGAFLPVFFCRSDGEALRSCIDAVNDAKHQFARHAGDYSLWRIGSFDDETGSLTGYGGTTGFAKMAELSELAPPI